MDNLRQYILSVVVASIMCACFRAIVNEKGMSGQVIKLICGLFLCFTLIRPITDIQIRDFALFTADIQSQAQEAAHMGEDIYRSSMANIIKEETEAYILDKAAALNAQVAVTVTIDEQLLPKRVKISGYISPYSKQLLEMIIEDDLGIQKEDQEWT